MKESSKEQFQRFKQDNPHLQGQLKAVEDTVLSMVECYERGGKVLVCGNGGSAADSEHIVGELMKGFLKKRPLSQEDRERLAGTAEDEAEFAWMAEKLQSGIPAISLVSHSALMTAFDNDVESGLVFAQQVMGYGTDKDLFIGLSTSGNSRNVVYGAKAARSRGMTVIGFTGAADSELSRLSHITLRSVETETYKVQEDHIKLYHLLCAVVENEIFES